MTSPKNSLQTGQFVEAVAYLLRETFEGSPEGQPSAYLDRGVGFFNTIDDLTAEQVSREYGQTTIAAQTEHAKFYLDRLCEFIGGRTERVNWEDSWLIDTVTDDEWNALRSAVKKAYESALKCLAGTQSWDATKAGMAIGLVAHTAYHLGAIRQIAKSVKQ
jgi:enamine deaminase RidA (YjgF/YER057c/UK114 family)